MGLRSKKVVSAHLLLETRAILCRTSPRLTIWQALWAARTCAPSLAFRHSSTTSMFLATCAMSTAWSIAGTSLAQPERTGLRRTQLRGFLPPSAIVWGWPPMALLAATYRRTSSTHLQPETTLKVVSSEQESPGSSSTPTKRRRRSGESCTRRQNRPVSSWQRWMCLKSLWTSCKPPCQPWNACCWPMATASIVSTTHKISRGSLTGRRLWTTSAFPRARRPGLRHARRLAHDIGDVGGLVCTWLRTSKAGYTVRTKLYNKVVSNFEAGEVHEPIGGHLVDYANCLNVHLHHTFLHPLHSHRSLSVRLPRVGWGTSRLTRSKRWWRRLWPWSPPQICRWNKACLWPSCPPSSGRTWPCAERPQGQYSSPGTRTRQQAGSRVSGSGPPRQTRTRRRPGRAIVGRGRLGVPRMSHLLG